MIQVMWLFLTNQSALFQRNVGKLKFVNDISTLSVLHVTWLPIFNQPKYFYAKILFTLKPLFTLDCQIAMEETFSTLQCIQVSS